MTDHPLTETAAAELWDASRDPRRPGSYRHKEMHHDERDTAVAALRAAFDAGREHERANPVDDRPVKALPNKLGAVIVPAPGHETITATDPADGTVWRTREAVCTGLSHWMGVWRDEAGTFSSVMPAGWITTDTWQEDRT